MVLSTESQYKPINEKLLQRYCEIFEISDWKTLSSERLGQLVYAEMPQFWKKRAEEIRSDDPDELLKNTTVGSAHTFEGSPAVRAGYSERTASSQGDRLLKNVKVQAKIQELQAERSRRTEITADDALLELAAIGFSPITDFLEVVDGQVLLKDSAEYPDNSAGAIASIRQSKDGGVAVKMTNKVQALSKLGEHLGLFSDLNAAISTLKTYGDIIPTTEGYRVVLETSKNS